MAVLNSFGAMRCSTRRRWEKERNIGQSTPTHKAELNSEPRCSLIIEARPRLPLRAAFALATALVLGFPGSNVFAVEGEPIPGVDIYLGKIPGGIIIKVPSDASARFSVRLPPGNYTISTACRQAPCASHAINGSHVISAVADGTGSKTYGFTVGESGPFVFSGQIAEPASTPGFGQAITFTATVARSPDPVAASSGFKISDNESPRPQDRNRIPDPAVAGDAAPGIFDRWGNRPEPVPNEAAGKPRGVAGTPVSGTPVGIERDPGDGQLRTATTDANGIYSFAGLPSGKYTLTIAGGLPKSVTVGGGGLLKGKVVHGSDGNPVTLVISGNVGTGMRSTAPGAGFNAITGVGASAGVPGSIPGGSGNGVSAGSPTGIHVGGGGGAGAAGAGSAGGAGGPRR